ncbi:hypothetical protein, partial [Sanguibacter sp. 26GB23]|uniref:hypothetical protein n=1 Tax=Sanguibacter sp. 26GB23 TaxID=3156066 RepID=UPI0032AED217
SRTPGDLQRLVALLIDWLEEPGHAGLRRAFTEWLRRVLLPRRFPGARMPELQELQEVNTMLRERVKEWTREWREQGLAQGLEQGLEQG